VEYRARPIREGGTITGAVVSFTDITERKRVEEQLKLAAKVFESTTEGVTITDTDGRILAVNKAFTLVTGYSEAEVLGRNPNLLQSGRHDPAFYAAMWASVRQTGHWQGEVWNRRKDGEVYPEWLTINSVQNEAGAISNYVGVFADISAIKKSQEQLDYLAHHDPLTDLPNRLLLTARLTHALQRAHRETRQVAVIFLDLDRFKNFNDTFGHPAGDRLLQAVARRLHECVREEDTVARLGGDEFLLIAEDLAWSRDAAPVAQKVLDALNRPFTLPGDEDLGEIYVTASLGVSLYPQDGEEVATLVKNADAAMYRAKDQGRNNFQFYTTELTAIAFERFTLETCLRHALEREELAVYFQPMLELAGSRIVGVEALARWRHPDLGLVAPDRFIPLAEDTGLIVPIGEWVLRAACAQTKTWQAAGHPTLRLAVNVSGRQFLQKDLTLVIVRVLQDTGFDPHLLELEITESFISENAEQTIASLWRLKELGISLAIDDFGTGYSSLSQLKRFPIDKLKIDRSFVRDIASDADDTAITRAIIAMGHSLQLQVIAEGVESRQQHDFLLAEGCDQAQGYLYSPPVPAEELLGLLQHPEHAESLAN
jgi:diguanylate cyclase (GGDEF)-like protein/PAS domain S-box-containing protein